MRHAIATVLLACLPGCVDRSAATDVVAEPIVNGTFATAASHPYAVFLSMDGPTDVTWKCSGTLIAPDVVLTAAHCTVCATGVAAWILGESAPGQEPGTQPVIFHPASSWSHNPAAFPDLPDCSIDDPEAFELELDQKTVNGADVGIVHLATPSAIQPMPALTHPPRGFNPRQDLYGQPVTMLGRGWTGMFEADKDDSHMRYGTGDLDAWGRLSGTCIDSEIDQEPWTIRLFNESWEDPPIFEASTAPTDSGGPLIGKVNGKDRVIAVTSGGFGISLSVEAPVFTATNSAYLRGELGDNVAVFDNDQDDIDDVADNCPGQANPDQTDRDEDGVGDLCDNCTPISTSGLPAFHQYDGTPASDYAAYYNPDQANCNEEAELDRILTEHPEFGSSLPSVTPTDYLLGYGEEDACHDGLVGARHHYLRGDACDPIPCTRVETITADVTDQVVPAAPDNICQVNGYGIGTCSYERPDGFWLESITQPADDGAHGKVGLRFCECDGERDTALERRQNCGAASTFNCAIEGSMYSSAGSPWKPVSVGPPEVDTVFGPDRPEVAVPWDFLGDLAAWSGTAIPPPPWELEDGHIVGGPDVEGVLWSRVAFYGGYEIDEHPYNNFSARKYGEIASWYRKADTAIRTVVHWLEFPQYRPQWPWEYCARCVLDLPWTWVLDVEREAVIGVGPDGAEDVSQLFDQVAVQLIGGTGLRVGAAEPEYQLAGTTRREVVVDGASQTVIGALHVDAGPADGATVEGQLFSGQHSGARAARASLAPAAGSLFAYSAVRDELYAVATDRAAPPLLVWTGERGWRELTVQGDRLLQPVAMTFRLAEGALYLLDRERAGSPIRLVRVDLDTGAVEVRDARLVEGSPSSVSLSNGLDGNLLIAGTFTSMTRLARVDVRARTPQLVARADRAGGMVGDARETRAGVGFLVPRGDFFDPRVVPTTAFEPVRDGNPRPIFPR